MKASKYPNPSLARVSWAALALGVLAIPPLAHAADNTWTGANTNSYGDAASWDPTGKPATTDNIVGNTASSTNFTGSGANTIANFANTSDWTISTTSSAVSTYTITGTLSQSVSDTVLVFRSGSDNNALSLVVNDVSVTAGTLRLGDANFNRLASLSGISTTSVSQGAILTVNVYSGTEAGNGDYSLGTLTMNGTLNLSSRTTGYGVDFTASVLSLSGTNSFATILGNAQANGSSATLAITGSATTSYAGRLIDGNTGTALSLVKSGTGSQTLSGNNTFTGGTTVNDGTLILASTTALGTGGVILNAGIIDLNGSSTQSVSVGGDYEMNDGTLSVSYSAGTYDQLVGSGSNTFTIVGGTLDLGNYDWDYGQSYALFSGFDSGSVSGLSIINYDTANYLATLNSNGVLSFASIPEARSFALLLGVGCVLLGLSRRLRRR